MKKNNTKSIKLYSAAQIIHKRFMGKETFAAFGLTN